MAISQKDIRSSLLMRVLYSLGYESLLDMTLASGIPHDDLKALQKGARGATEDMDYSETWQRIAIHVDERLGMVMAAREELQRKLNLDRLKRAERRKAILCR